MERVQKRLPRPAVLTLSGGVDSFCAGLKAKEEGFEIAFGVFVDYGIGTFERDYEAAKKASNYLGVPLRLISISGLKTHAVKKHALQMTGIPYKYSIALLLASSLAAAEGINTLIASEVSISNDIYLNSIKSLLLTSPLVQPGIDLVVYKFKTEEIVEVLKKEGFNQENYFFATCNEKEECGRCPGCRKKTDILSLLK